MKKSIVITIALLISLLLFSLPVSATVTYPTLTPADDATGIWVNRSNLIVNITSSTGHTMNGTITLVATGDTLTISSAMNSTQTMTIATGNLPLDALTTYQWYVNVTDNANLTLGWVNTSFNFTTSSPARLSENTGLSSSELVLVGLLSLAILLIVIFMVFELLDGKPDPKRLLGMLIAIVMMVIAMGFI